MIYGQKKPVIIALDEVHAAVGAVVATGFLLEQESVAKAAVSVRSLTKLRTTAVRVRVEDQGHGSFASTIVRNAARSVQ